MASSYPGALDSLPNPTSTTARNAGSGLALSEVTSNANDAIEAIQATLGVDPQGSETTVGDRIAALEGGGGGGGGLVFICNESISASSSYNLPNDTFTTTYDHYKVVITLTAASGTDVNLWIRMRASGTTDTGSNYAWQLLNGYGGGNTAADGSGSASAIKCGFVSTGYAGYSTIVLDVLSPKLAAQTILTGTRALITSGGNYYTTNVAGWHKTAAAQDSLTLYPDSGTITGKIAVYGYALA